MSIQLEAVAAAGALALAALLAQRLWAWRAGGLALAAAGPATGRPYILYFTTESCTVCRTRQEPALAGLSGAEVRRIDALAEPDLARRFHVYTVPTTVVVGGDGATRHVNYGFASTARLRTQLSRV